MFPSSNVARQCLALVCAWIARLPAKKIRINSYLKKTKISWMEEMKLVYDERVPDTQLDHFQLAFSSHQKHGNDKRDAQNMHFLEFAAFFEVLSSVSLGKRTDFKRAYSGA